MAKEMSKTMVRNLVEEKLRLSRILAKIYIKGMNDGMPTAWLYDCTIALVASKLVDKALSTKNLSDAEAEELVSSVECIDFDVYGEIKTPLLHEESHTRRKEFAVKVVAPLYKALLADAELKEELIGAVGLLGFIVEEWVEKE